MYRETGWIYLSYIWTQSCIYSLKTPEVQSKLLHVLYNIGLE